MRRAIGLSLIGIAACSSSHSGDDGAASGDQAIVGGQLAPTTASPGAGYLVRDGKASCTASLIAPDLVMTAAHCVASEEDVSFGWGEVSANTTMHSNTRAIHPRYIEPPNNGDVAWQGFDMALVKLEAPVTAIAPLPLGPTPTSGSVMGIGYGSTSYVLGADGTMQSLGAGTDRKSATGLVISQNPVELFVRFDAGSSTCYGDSGSPLFASGNVVGVLSRFLGTTRCLPEDRTLMGYTRVDAMDSFFTYARQCMSATASAPADVASCLRDDTKHLCVSPLFSNRNSPMPVTTSTGDLHDGSSSFTMNHAEERTVRLVPQANVKLSLFSQGDAVMDVSASSSSIAKAAAEAMLTSNVPYDIVIRSCTGEEQMMTLVWQAQ